MPLTWRRPSFVAHISTPSGTKMPKINLRQLMQAINLLSFSLLLTPIALWFLGIQTQLSRKHDYLYSIEQFVPEIVLKLWFYEDLPIQTIQFKNFTLYFPGVAIECVLGVIQGIILGRDLLRTPHSGNYQTRALPAANLFFYAGMCISAMPLHCLKDMAIFDISAKTMLTQGLFWVDTLCTSCVPPTMLLCGLVECGFVPSHRQWLLGIIVMINGFLTWVGVFHHQRWVMFFLHILFQTVFLFPLLYLTRKRVKRTGCSHGYDLMVRAKVCSLICAYTGFSLAVPLSNVTLGAYCPLTSVFVGCRVGMVQYWIYCKKQVECNCAKKKIV